MTFLSAGLLKPETRAVELQFGKVLGFRFSVYRARGRSKMVEELVAFKD